MPHKNRRKQVQNEEEEGKKVGMKILMMAKYENDLISSIKSPINKSFP